MIQPKLKIGNTDDSYEKQADQVANKVVQNKSPISTRSGESSPANELQTIQTQTQPGSHLGNVMDARTNEKMSRKMGYDFSGIRVHTHNTAVDMNNRLNARAFTCGSDIFFNKNEYNSNSLAGERILAHELTHVVQQSKMGANTAGNMIQRTTAGDVLDEYFSPTSVERLWLMPESDAYTRLVRRWQPVIDTVNNVKADLLANCSNWNTIHKTDSSWTPSKTDPPVTDPNAHDTWVPSPPGTDPGTCAVAFVEYHATGNQTFALQTCSIGSFGIYATIDAIDCNQGAAVINFWMYNAMDQGSFGPFTHLFPFSGQQRQYMWWNWDENLIWGAGPISPTNGTIHGNSAQI
ncbi:MAG: eCIS core domain-containing protein [Akkermansiaceae bacterium]